ncbi:hypothetical protein AAFF_G00344040 [Aldrovandia affinis]|uniref:HAT C-terminal dimerisation domain-containing protein n=1 Tax=Aldrovandia affinis TaxID=143900 RepID=A0AAD7WPY2_9TELE|nr:hypothetical protein AAFF_G00344040 [Aldrovandia affinis]
MRSHFKDPREWPTEEADLASYGADHLRVITHHFADILDWVCCDRGQARHQEWPSAKVVIKALPQVQQGKVWADFLTDPERLQSFPNLLMVVELILMLSLSTAACERGFSAMKRIKTDWRSNLSVDMLWKLLCISIEGPAVANFDAERVVQRWLSAGQRACWV